MVDAADRELTYFIAPHKSKMTYLHPGSFEPGKETFFGRIEKGSTERRSMRSRAGENRRLVFSTPEAKAL